MAKMLKAQSSISQRKALSIMAELPLASRNLRIAEGSVPDRGALCFSATGEGVSDGPGTRTSCVLRFTMIYRKREK